MVYSLLSGNPIQSHLDHPCTSYLASKSIDTNSRPKVALTSGSKLSWIFKPFSEGDYCAVILSGGNPTM